MEIYNKTNSSKVKYYDSPIYIYNSFVQDENNLSTTQNYGDREINDHLFVITNMKNINEKWLQLRIDVFIKCMMENLIFITNIISEDTFCSLKKTFNSYFKNYKFNFIKRYLDIVNIIINGNYCEFLEIIKPRVLISGFDFKFINELLDNIKSDYNLKLDKWDGHTEKKWKINNNDNKILKENLDWADIIFCEWMLGNAVFYSNHKRNYQKLFIRCHRFELTRNDFKDINIKNVNKIICVSQYYKRLTNEITNFELNKLIYIPNYIDTKKYEYSYDYYYTIAIVGILPTRKNLFKALEILKEVNDSFPQIQFNIYGKTYKDCSWMINDEETIKYFDKCDNYVKTNNLKVNYKGFQDMKTELKKNDFVLSLSEKEKIFESFHIGPAEGFVCGCISLFTDWYGVDDIYPNEYIFTEITKISDFIIDFYKNNKDKSQINKKGRDHIIKNYDIDIVKNKFKILFSR
jgi:glycosyltransferase involved in cell wall biosynthesis